MEAIRIDDAIHYIYFELRTTEVNEKIGYTYDTPVHIEPKTGLAVGMEIYGIELYRELLGEAGSYEIEIGMTDFTRIHLSDKMCIFNDNVAVNRPETAGWMWKRYKKYDLSHGGRGIICFSNKLYFSLDTYDNVLLYRIYGRMAYKLLKARIEDFYNHKAQLSMWTNQ